MSEKKEEKERGSSEGFNPEHNVTNSFLQSAQKAALVLKR